MRGAEPGLVLFTDLEVQVNGVAFLLTPIRYLPHGQSGFVHHVPFRMPRHFPTRHAGNTSPRARGVPELLSSCGQNVNLSKIRR